MFLKPGILVIIVQSQLQHCKIR